MDYSLRLVLSLVLGPQLLFIFTCLFNLLVKLDGRSRLLLLSFPLNQFGRLVGTANSSCRPGLLLFLVLLQLADILLLNDPSAAPSLVSVSLLHHHSSIKSRKIYLHILV